jgi:hypothetical protein
VYSDWSEWTFQIRPLLEAAHIPRSRYIAWDAFYNGIPHIDARFDGTQYTSACLHKNLDCSLVYPRFLRIARPPLEPRHCGRQCVPFWERERRTLLRRIHRHCPHASPTCRAWLSQEHQLWLDIERNRR